MKKTITLLAVAFCLNTNAQIITTVAGNGTTGYSGDGGASIAAKLHAPQGLAIDAAGNVYIADADNHSIRKMNATGIISTIAGNGTQGYSGDGGPATSALLSYPLGMALDAAGNLYIADVDNAVIRKINTLGIISTIAGNGTLGYSGDGGQATFAQLYHPSGVTVDALGNVYIADCYNSVIRKVDTSGIISTYAGNHTYGYSGDGLAATSAELSSPWGVAVDASGNVYIADQDNQVIRKVNSAGVISTFAGNGMYGWSGDGGQAALAELRNPIYVAIDASGSVYIADYGNSIIRKVNTSGIISTYAGLEALWGYSGDGGLAISAELNYPSAIAFDIVGNVYIADKDNNVVREVGMCIPVIPSICMVEVDSLSQNNIIYWDNTPYAADTFYIYRDTANYNYALIGKVLASSLSMFTDTVHHLYAANGDPNASSWRYKIAYRDTCGGVGSMSPMSPYHQTVFMITNSIGNFIWTQYQIEGQSTPVSQISGYLFEVDSSSSGHYKVVQSLSASSTAYHDSYYATYSNPTWRSTAYGFNCTPTMKFANKRGPAAIVSSKSNISNNSNNSVQGINQFSGDKYQVSIYPNPTTGIINIESSSPKGSNMQINVYDMLGNNVYASTLQGGVGAVALPSGLGQGVYFISIQTNEGIVNKKIVISK